MENSIIVKNLWKYITNDSIYHNYCCSGSPSTSTLTYSTGAS